MSQKKEPQLIFTLEKSDLERLNKGEQVYFDELYLGGACFTIILKPPVLQDIVKEKQGDTT
jgi:paraquat-inducible protein B